MIPVEKKSGTAELLFSRAYKMGLDPTWLTPNGLFVVKTNNGERYVNHELSSLNSHVSASLARNKYLTRLILERHNLPNIPYARPKSLEAALDFLAEHGKIIVKPVRGAGAKDIWIVSEASQLAALNIAGCIFEKYTPGKEMRYLVLNGSVIAVHESKYGDSVDQHRYLERVSHDPTTWDSKLDEMSVEICDILGLSFAAVDYLIDEEGCAYILEVNSSPGFKWFHAPSEGPVVDVAKLFMEAMVINTKSAQQPN